MVAVCKSYDLIHEMSSSSSFMSVAVAEANATEYVKKSASGYGKYGTKQDCIEGALEELDTMIKHYNLICMKKLGNK